MRKMKIVQLKTNVHLVDRQVDALYENGCFVEKRMCPAGTGFKMLRLINDWANEQHHIR
jgi:hypothetical protein